MANIEERKTHEGKTMYRVKVRLKGFPTQTATFHRRTDARKWAQATETAMREGRHFKTVEAKKHRPRSRYRPPQTFWICT